MMMSTPAAASVRAASGSSTVQTLTRRPASCAAAIAVGARRERGRRRRGSATRDRARPRSARPSPTSWPCVSHPVGDVGRVLVREVDRGQIERRHDHGARVRRRQDATTASIVARITEPSCVGVGLPRQALHLDVHDQAAARVERFGEGRDVGARRRAARRASAARSRPTPATSGSWCTISTPSALRRTSSSTPSAPSSRARANAAIVFSGATADAPRWPRTSGRRGHVAGSIRGRARFRKHVPPCIAYALLRPLVMVDAPT